MQEEGAQRLELLAPLFYIPAPELVPFHQGIGPRVRQETGGEEFLFCFKISEAQGQRIDPEPSVLLDSLLAAGFAPQAGCPGGNLQLPRGRYLFAQERAFLGREGAIRLAVEIQKDGLWERFHLENRLYLRYLYEDGGIVTQLFRPYTSGPGR